MTPRIHTGRTVQARHSTRPSGREGGASWIVFLSFEGNFLKAGHMIDHGRMAAVVQQHLNDLAYDTKWACEIIKPVLAQDGFVVGLQNGMTHENIATIVGRHRTIGAVIEQASNMWTPGVTNRQNDNDESWFAMGALDPEMQHRVEGVAHILRLSGTVEVVDDIRSAKWMKLVVNAAELIPSAIARARHARSDAGRGV